MNKKKVKFDNLKARRKFRHNRKLYIKDMSEAGVQLSNGYIKCFDVGTMVTPVKVKITVI